MVYGGFWLLRLQVEAQNHHGENLINSSVAATPVKFASKQMVLGMEWGSKDVFGVRKCLFAANCVLQLVFFFWGVGGAWLFLVAEQRIDA